MSWSDFLKLDKPPKYIIGSDENGTGALAGPILVTACVFLFEWEGFEGVCDSKTYSSKKHKLEAVAERVYQAATSFSQIYLWPDHIDKVGMGYALRNGHRQVIQTCQASFPDSLTIVDGNSIIPEVDHLPLPKADGLVPAVSAASILGKVERDWWMSRVADAEHPEYGFARHVGYDTGEHRKMLNHYGPCGIHRKSYKPVRDALKGGSR